MSEEEKQSTALVVARPDHSNDDAVVDYTQAVRIHMIESMARGEMPSEARDRELMLSTLRDLSGTAMAKKKLGVEERDAGLDRKAQLFIAAMFAGGGTTVSPFEETPEGEGVAEGVIPSVKLGRRFSADTPDSVKERGIPNERYDQFQERMEPLMREQRDRQDAESQR